MNINVNLIPCDCGGRRTFHSTTHEPSTLHLSSCAGAPQHLPCRVPGSFACEVVLGECSGKCGWSNMHHQNRITHFTSCPARPIRVSASINSPDGSWERSEVVDVELRRGDRAGTGGLIADIAAANTAIRDRWALVKDLVCGRVVLAPWAKASDGAKLLAQRDAVFAALADMARAEEALQRAEQACAKHLPRANVPRIGPSPAADWLDAYVEHVREQVGVL